MDELQSSECETLTGAELFYQLTKANEQLLEENGRKISEYTNLREILQNITDRCRVPILAPVASGMAYFEATIDYTNNILVLLGESWFAERSAKQACEIASRRLEFLRREEAALLAEKSALAERQNLFIAEVPMAQQALREVEAAKQATLDAYGKTDGNKIFHHDVPHLQSSPSVSNNSTVHPQVLTRPLSPNASEAFMQAQNPASENEMMPLELGPDDQDLAIFNELDFLTEDELLDIERELGDKIDDDELVERIITERLLEKKEKRVREELRQKQANSTNSFTTSDVQVHVENPSGAPAVSQPATLSSTTTTTPNFISPGDIGRAAEAVVREAGVACSTCLEVDSATVPPQRRVRFNDVLNVVAQTMP
ncbi:putative Prefoldin subunit [Trypanosoma vivax]|nr:putative Prefoldin subunit [Trypanosoma vivax]